MEPVESINRAINYIEGNLTETISLEEVSAVAGYSLFHFSRLFLELIGETPGDYIRKRRLSEAAREFVTLQTSLQVNTSNDYLGRVFGVYATVNALFMVIGQGVATILGDYLGIVPLLNLAAGLYFFSGVIALILLPKRATP